MALYKNGLPMRLATRILDGELKTRTEWADALDITPDHVRALLTTLRKNNYMFYPVGSGYKKEGVIKNVVRQQKDYRETSERMANNYTNPAILASFRLLENYLLEDPQSHDEIEVQANNLLMMVMNRKKLLLERKTNGTT